MIQSLGRTPETTPAQQGNIIVIGSQKPGQATTINGQTVQVFGNAISIAGTTLSAGTPPITVSGTPIALGSEKLVIGSISVQIALPPLSLTTGQVTTHNGEVFRQLPTGISVAGSILTPGAPGIMVSGTPVSLGPSTLIIGSISIPVTWPPPPGTPGPMTNTAGEVVQPLSTGVPDFGTTLTLGGHNASVSIDSVDVAGADNDTGKGVQAFQGSAKALKSRLAETLPFWLLCACIIHFY